jgi:Ca2+-binding RTX toxin-like protein
MRATSFAGSDNDLINGAQGTDNISGDEGRDRIYGGAGGEDIVAGWRDGAKDYIYCGPGVDWVSDGRRDELFKCERRY